MNSIKNFFKDYCKFVYKTTDVSESGIVRDVFNFCGIKIKIKSKIKTKEYQCLQKENELKNYYEKLLNEKDEYFSKTIKNLQDDYNLIIKQKDMIIGENYFSQFGEDRIIDLVFSILKNKGIISDVTYLDVGGNRPCQISNTYHFYLEGCKGVVIEPNPRLYETFKKVRPNDNVLNIGIHFDNSETTLPFYIFNEDADGLSSFSKESADEMLRDCPSAIKYDVINIPVRNINTIIEDYFDSAPTFISIDVEGIDFDILKSFDFTKFRPIFWIIETASYTGPNFLGVKSLEIQEFMFSKGYVVYADTYVNTIFIDSDIFDKIKKQ